MGPSLTSQELQCALAYITKKLDGIEYFVFYGTLLGVCREGHPIEGDDDIDIMVPRRLRSDLIKLLSLDTDNNLILDHVSPINQTPYFLQIIFNSQKFSVNVDFYFFDEDDNFLYEKWTKGAWANGKVPLRIPRELIYPLKVLLSHDLPVKCPMYPDACSELIYGQFWRTPKSKNYHYDTYLEDGILLRKRVGCTHKAINFIKSKLRSSNLARYIINHYRI